MKFAHLTLAVPEAMRHPMHEFVMEHQSAEKSQLLNWNLSAEERTVALFRVFADPEPYRRAIQSAAPVEEYLITRVDERSFYLYVEERPDEWSEGFEVAFTGRRLMVVPPMEFTEGGRVTFGVVGRQADFGDLVADMEAITSVQVDQLGEYAPRRGGARSGSTPATRLTERQTAAVEAAVEAGYYAVPREGSVEDVAAALDCAPSTASNHLRKAEARLMGSLFG
jgi:hypothetical protein